jgi:broad specificity phosphatase PhoE
LRQAYAAPVPTVLLVRHAQASFGTADYDVLSPLGHEQTEVVVEALLGRRMNVTRIVAGTARRQIDTAAPLAARLGLEVGTDPRWNEYETERVLEHHGTVPVGLDGAGAGGREISSREFQAVLDGALEGWVRSGEETPAPQSWPAFLAAGTGALVDLAASLGSGETGIAFTSGGVIGTICTELLGGHPDLLPRLNRVLVNTGITKIAVGGSGTSLIAFNDHAHIDAAGGAFLSYR